MERYERERPCKKCGGLASTLYVGGDSIFRHLRHTMRRECSVCGFAWHEAPLDTQWWLNAIADELDAEGPGEYAPNRSHCICAKWLRAEARATHESETTEQKEP